MEKVKVFLPDVRISYPSLVEPRAGLQGGDPKYDATFLMAPDSGAAHNLTAAVQDIAHRAFGNAADKILQSNSRSRRVMIVRTLLQATRAISTSLRVPRCVPTSGTATRRS